MSDYRRTVSDTRRTPSGQTLELSDQAFRERGFGLGPAIVKKLADLQRLEMIMESEIGEGTVVTGVFLLALPESFSG